MKKRPHIQTYYIEFGKYSIRLWKVESRYESGEQCVSKEILKLGFGGW